MIVRTGFIELDLELILRTAFSLVRFAVLTNCLLLLRGEEVEQDDFRLAVILSESTQKARTFQSQIKIH